MDRFSRFIVKRPMAVIIIFALLIVPSILGMLHTDTNYDLLSYLPRSLNSVQGQDILDEVFGIGDTIYLITDSQKLWEAEKLKTGLMAIPGIEDVLWLDTYSDTAVPLEFMPEQIKENFISGSNTLMQIQISPDYEAQNGPIVQNIRQVAQDSRIAGYKAVIEDFQAIIDSEMGVYLLIGFIAIFIILALATTSILEPVLLLLSVGIAILINMGSNFFIGEISYITGSVAAVMQLAVCMDYSIFLIHRYHQEKKLCPACKEEAMARALSSMGPTVSSSALTTVAGFGALMIMQLGMGKDLGFVLAKGVVISLITTLTFLPALVLATDRWLDKATHRIFLPRFNLISKWILKFRWVFLVILLLAVIPAYIAHNNLDYYFSTGKMLSEDAQSIKDTEYLKQEFGQGDIIYVITEDGHRLEQEAMADEIEDLEHVSQVSGLSQVADPYLPRQMLPSQAIEQFSKGGYTHIYVQLTSERDSPQATDTIQQIRNIAGRYFNHYYVAGEAVLTSDMAAIAPRDLKLVNILSISLVAIILAITFKSISIPAILILLIEAAIWINLSIPYWGMGEVSFMTPIFIGAIQLGATIDYAILFTSSYQESLKQDLDCSQAAQEAITNTGQSILTSALILLVATLAIALFTSVKATAEFTFSIGRGAVISMVSIFLGLPSLLVALDKIIGWTTWKWRKN